METFDSYGGSTLFAKNISDALFIDFSRIKISSVKKGSVIVQYKIMRSEDDDLEQIN
jgi:hypothetical protein